MTIRNWILMNWRAYADKKSLVKACVDELNINRRTVYRKVEKLEKIDKLISFDGSEVNVNVDSDIPEDLQEAQEETVEDVKDIEMYEGSAHITLLKKCPMTVQELIDEAELDSDIWEVSEGVVQFYGNEKWPNRQLKARFKRKVAEEAVEFIEKLKGEVSRIAPIYPKVEYDDETLNSEFMLEIDIFDAHLGMIGEKYTVERGCARYYNSVCRILNWYKDKKIGKILLVVGNDLMNSNALSGATKKGTPMEDEAHDCRYTYEKAFETLVRSIELCRTIAPVEVISVEGNHDPDSTYFIVHALSAYFNNCEEVTVINTGKPYQFVTWGKNLIGLTHGELCNVKELPLIMCTESDPRAWIESKIRMWRIGHGHHKKSRDFITKPLELDDDVHGVRVSMCAALTDRSFWARSKGYGSVKEATGCLWHKELGDIAYFSFKYGLGEI